ncbi:hypothetical protein LXL04_031590 [Taraxacum kok-saghyz]
MLRSPVTCFEVYHYVLLHLGLILLRFGPFRLNESSSRSTTNAEDSCHNQECDGDEPQRRQQDSDGVGVNHSEGRGSQSQRRSISPKVMEF